MPVASDCAIDAITLEASREGNSAAVPDLADYLTQDLRLTDARGELTDSSCGDSEGRASDTASPSQLFPAECNESLHQLSNLVTGILLNAQMLEWKLPPYSHLKRPVRELERNAQRSGELLKGLIRRCSQRAEPATEISRGRQESSLDGIAGSGGSQPLPVSGIYGPSAGLHLTPSTTGLQGKERDLTLGCDGCTSSVVPKRDDGSDSLTMQAPRRERAAEKGQFT